MQRETTDDVPPEHLATMKAFLADFSGICNFNYKLRPEGGMCIFEVNARIGADLACDATRSRAAKVCETPTDALRDFIVSPWRARSAAYCPLLLLDPRALTALREARHPHAVQGAGGGGGYLTQACQIGDALRAVSGRLALVVSSRSSSSRRTAVSQVPNRALWRLASSIRARWQGPKSKKAKVALAVRAWGGAGGGGASI
jgi:hypothetical protein